LSSGKVWCGIEPSHTSGAAASIERRPRRASSTAAPAISTPLWRSRINENGPTSIAKDSRTRA
jgi:hypothetical protein